jgi:hypothetical protein
VNLLDKPFRFDTIEFCQVGIEHDLLPTNEKDPGGDGFDGNRRKRFGHWLLEIGEKRKSIKISKSYYKSHSETSIISGQGTFASGRFWNKNLFRYTILSLGNWP